MVCNGDLQSACCVVRPPGAFGGDGSGEASEIDFMISIYQERGGSWRSRDDVLYSRAAESSQMIGNDEEFTSYS